MSQGRLGSLSLGLATSIYSMHACERTRALSHSA